MIVNGKSLLASLNKTFQNYSPEEASNVYILFLVERSKVNLRSKHAIKTLAKKFGDFYRDLTDFGYIYCESLYLVSSLHFMRPTNTKCGADSPNAKVPAMFAFYSLFYHTRCGKNMHA